LFLEKSVENVENARSHSLIEMVTVIIPTKNEAEGIRKVIEEIEEVGIPPERIIVVDGHSSDGTADIAKDLGARVYIQRGTGKADAVKLGLRHVETKYAVVMDGDATYPAKFIPSLVERAEEEGCGLVLGARKVGRDKIGIINRFGNWVINKLFSLYFGANLSDILTGMYLINVSRLKSTIFEMSGFSIEAEIVSHFVSMGEIVCELPIEYKERIGKKKLKVWHGFLIVRDIVRLAWRYSPVSFILLLSALLLIPGLALGVYVAYYYFFLDINYYVKGIAAITMTSSGFIALILGILTLYLKRMEIRLKKMIESLESMISDSK